MANGSAGRISRGLVIGCAAAVTAEVTPMRAWLDKDILTVVHVSFELE
jgi:hypothetical protein